MGLVTVQIQGADGTLSDVVLDAVGDRLYPIYKMSFGALGVDGNVVSVTNPMPVTAASLPLPAGASTSALQMTADYDTGAGEDSRRATGLVLAEDGGGKLVGSANPMPVDIGFRDTPAIDAFNRLRVAEPTTLFDSKQIFDSQPLFWNDVQTAGGGTGSAYRTNEASTRLSVSGTTIGTRVRQTFRRFNYQPGKSQAITMTGVLGNGSAGITQRVGLFDGSNGLFFNCEDGVWKVSKRSFVTGSAVDTNAAQSSWNLDTMDGNGVSGITLDFDNSQIFCIDFEWLGVGRIRFGFIVDGMLVYCHEFLFSNAIATVYMSTPNLPLRYEISNDGTGQAASIDHLCSTVTSEGGAQDTGILRYKSTEGTHVDANVANTVYALVGIRLKSGSLAASVKLADFSVMAETKDDFEWNIIFNPTVAGTFTYSDETNSAVQTATGATANTVSGGVIMGGGFVDSTKDGGGVFGKLENALLLGSTIGGVPDEIVLTVRPHTADADVQGSLTWRELS